MQMRAWISESSIKPPRLLRGVHTDCLFPCVASPLCLGMPLIPPELGAFFRAGLFSVICPEEVATPEAFSILHCLPPQGVLCDRCRELSCLPRVHVQTVRHCWLSDWYAYCRDGRSSCHALAFAQTPVTIGVALRAVGIAENAFSLGVFSFNISEQLTALRASFLEGDLHSASPSTNRTRTAMRSRASSFARLRDSHAIAWRTSFHSSSATETT